MSNLIDWGLSAFGSAESTLLAVSVIVSLAWQVCGLAQSRQWFLLPVAAGLSGLAAFLLNPLADSIPLVDLQQRFISGSGLVLLCACQLVAAAVSFWLGVQVARSQFRERWQLVLGAWHSMPAPMVLLGALLCEQWWLAEQVGSRPEWVGMAVAVGIASPLVLFTFLLAALPPSWLARGHLLSSLWMVVLASLLTSLDSRPPGVQAEAESGELAKVLWTGLSVVATCVGIGILLERVRIRPRHLYRLSVTRSGGHSGSPAIPGKCELS